MRADKSETNWLLLDFEGDKSDKLKLTGTGTGVTLAGRRGARTGSADLPCTRRASRSSRRTWETTARRLRTCGWCVLLATGVLVRMPDPRPPRSRTRTTKRASDQVRPHLRPCRRDAHSRHPEFIFITYIGPSVRIMRKAKISVQAADVKNVLRQASIDVPASSLEDLDEVRFCQYRLVYQALTVSSRRARSRSLRGCARLEERATTRHKRGLGGGFFSHRGRISGGKSIRRSSRRHSIINRRRVESGGIRKWERRPARWARGTTVASEFAVRVFIPMHGSRSEWGEGGNA